MRVLLRTFGCRANHYDSAMVRALAERGGHEIVDDPGAADLAVYNSCAVTADAERDLRKAVRRAATRNPGLRSVVMGCAAALPSSQESLRALPTVERLVAGADRAGLAALFGVSDPGGVLTEAQDTVRAVLRIQDGCDEHCTFCATTMARGANRSRAPELLVREASALSEHHPEIVLTGIHIGTYGADLGTSLGELVERLVREVPHVRFRLSSVEATEVDDRLMDLLAGAPRRLAPHLHAPLQSGSDRVLKRMGRHWYTARSYARRVEELVRRVPAPGLGADVIAGFPGESEADFHETLSLVEDLPFTYLHDFPYSPRPGTAATRLPGVVPAPVTRERAARLRDVAAGKARAHRRARAGGSADAIVIRAAPEREAMTEDFLTVPLAGAPRARGDRFTGRLETEGDTLVLY